MAPFLLLLFLLSAAASEEIKVTVDPGNNVTLPCLVADSSISAVEWTRPDLEPKYVLLSIDGHLETDEQNPSFKDRVELVDGERNVSLILMNVTMNDNGTYECRVTSAGSRRMKRAIIDSEPIRIIRLQVSEPAGSNSGHSKDGNSMNDVPENGPSSPRDRYVGLAGGVLLVAAAVVVVLMYKRHQKKRSGPSAADDKPLGALLI